MLEQPYVAETDLQGHLAAHPELLSAEAAEDERRRWLLVRREMGVADRTDGTDRWSLDHLFIDQDAVPTLVEVKRSSDTRLRREVVGQMLDYAANGAKYWPADGLRSAFDARCSAEGLDAPALLAEHLGGGDEDAFWTQVGENI